MSEIPTTSGQANHLRRVAADLEAGLPPRADRVAVVFGAKGGVGTSVIALAIARDLARRGKGAGVAALAIDAHAGRSDLEILSEEESPGLAVTTAAKLGVEPVAGEGAAASEAANRLLRAGRLWTEDNGGWIVIDAGVGDTGWARLLAARAHRPLLVTTADRLSVVNSYLTLKRLDQSPAGPLAGRVGLVVNHAAESAAEAAHASISASCQRFLEAAPTLAGWLPTQIDDPSEAPIAAAA